MRRSSVALMGVLLGLALAGCSPPKSTGSASDASSPANDPQLAKAQALVAGASGQRMKAVSLFDGPDQLVGIIIQPVEGGAKQLAWASPNLEVVLPTDALDKDGVSRNTKALLQQKVFISTPELAALVMDKGIMVGTKGPVITVFVDPNCIYCNKFYKQVMPLVKQGKVRVRFMMVGFLRPSSEARAAAIVSAKDPVRALDEDESNFTEAREQDNSAGTKADPLVARVVQDNTALMYRAGGSGTPAVLACQQDQPAPVFSSGMPQDVAAFVNTLDPGNPACK